jgi:hypothetical protein
LSRTNGPSCAKNDLPDLDIFASPTDIGCRAASSQMNPPLPACLGLLHHHHRLGPGWQWGAGHDTRALAIGDALAGPDSGRDLCDHLHLTFSIREAASKSIHRRLVEGRHVDIRADVIGKDPTQRLVEIDLLCLEPRYGRKDNPLGFFEG